MIIMMIMRQQRKRMTMLSKKKKSKEKVEASSKDKNVKSMVYINSKYHKKEKRVKKVTIVGDIIVNGMDNTLFDSLNADISFPGKEGGPRCYGSEYNHDHKYSNNNHKDIIPNITENIKTDILVMQGSTVDITHMGFMSRANKLKIAANSGYKMVEVAKNELKKNAELVVVLADRPYRVDDDEKQELSSFANFVQREDGLKVKVEYGERLILGEHSMVLGRRAEVEAIYGRRHYTDRYDGLHMRSTMGQVAYTRSIRRMIKKALLVA